MPTIINKPKTFRLNLLHFYDALAPILQHPKRRFIFLYLITKELSDLGFCVGTMYHQHYANFDRRNIAEIEFLIKEDINNLFLGVYANQHIVIRPYSDFIYDITAY